MLDRPQSRPEPRIAQAPRDTLGLRRALGDRLLPVLVGAMAFLASLALGFAVAAQSWADRWHVGAGSTMTAQVPQPLAPSDLPELTRLARALQVLRDAPAIAAAEPLSGAALDDMLRPWLGDQATVPADLLPAVVAVRVVASGASPASLDTLAATLAQRVPGAVLESHATWVRHLGALLRGLEACGWGALVLVASVAVLVIMAATRAGLVARRATVDILHGLGATDSYVAARFARRAMTLSAAGGLAGMLAAVPILLALARLAEPFTASPGGSPGGLPASLWAGLVLLPPVAAGIGYGTADGTVRLWLRRLP